MSLALRACAGVVMVIGFKEEVSFDFLVIVGFLVGAEIKKSVTFGLRGSLLLQIFLFFLSLYF